MKDINRGGEQHRIMALFDDWPTNQVGKPVEISNIEEQKSNLVLASESLVEDTKSAYSQSLGWLPAFAEQYNISADIRDYVLVPVTIMPSDLPNRNGQAFPIEELMRANVDTGQIAFESWSRKPCFTEHNNQDHTKAKGVILSSIIKPMKGSRGNLSKVICLSAWDRKRDPVLANQILTGERQAYSMGAMASFFTCSICAAEHTSKIEGCEHVAVKRPGLRIQPAHPVDKLAYLQARYPTGFELSSVSSPAYEIARTDPSKYLRVD